jgi:hypothetical protein
MSHSGCNSEDRNPDVPPRNQTPRAQYVTPVAKTLFTTPWWHPFIPKPKLNCQCQSLSSQNSSEIVVFLFMSLAVYSTSYNTGDFDLYNVSQFTEVNIS